jgi:hypothetical protein
MSQIECVIDLIYRVASTIIVKSLPLDLLMSGTYFLLIGPNNGIWYFILDWLIDYLLFYVLLKNISLIWRRHHCRWRAAKFRPMLGAQGIWAGRDLYRATPAVARDLGFSGLIQGLPHSVTSYDTHGDADDLF